MFFILLTWIFNIVIFQSFKYFNEENQTDNFDCFSVGSNSTNDGNNNVEEEEINFDENNEIYIQNSIIEKISQIFIDSYAQTI